MDIYVQVCDGFESCVVSDVLEIRICEVSDDGFRHPLMKLFVFFQSYVVFFFKGLSR